MLDRSRAVQSTAQANAYAERLIGSIRRECLAHVIVWNQRGLRRIVNAYAAYYQRSRTRLSLDKDSPIPRETAQGGEGRVVAIPQGRRSSLPARTPSGVTRACPRGATSAALLVTLDSIWSPRSVSSIFGAAI